jgi:hypothetical protein
MNKIIEKINWSEGSYWGEPGKFKFRCAIDSFDDDSDLTENKRSIKTNFSVTLNGYLLPDSYPPTADTTEQFITPSQIVMSDDTDSTIFAPDSGITGADTTFIGGSQGSVASPAGGGGTGSGSMEILTLQPGNNLVFSDVLYDGTTAVTATLGMSETPIFTSVSASNITFNGSISGSLTSTGSFGRVEATDIVAQTYTVSSSVTNISIATLSGSTQFGDTLDDTHQFTGSLLLDGDMTSTSTGSFGFIEVGGEPVVANVIIDGGSF